MLGEAGETSENNTRPTTPRRRSLLLERGTQGSWRRCAATQDTEALSAGCDGRVLVHDPERGASNGSRWGGPARQKTHDYGNGEPPEALLA